MSFSTGPVALPWARRLAVAGGLALLGVAAVLLAQWRSADAAAQSYLDSPCTSHPRPGVCPGVAGATVERTALDVDARGGLHALVSIVPGGATRAVTVEGIWPTDAFRAMHPGTHVVVIDFAGRPASLRLDPTRANPNGLRLWTTYNPVPDRYLRLDLALAVAGVGLLALLLAVPPRLSRLPVRRLGEALRDGRLRLAVLALVIAQLLDVVTSILGRRELLYEGTSITRAMVDRYGDVGFLAVKVPAVLVVVLLAARLPRRWAVVPVVATAAAVLVVVAGNVRLLATG